MFQVSERKDVPMKPTQSPSNRQILKYDISSQRFGIYSLFIGIPSLGLSLYGLISGASEYVWIGLVGLLVSFFEVARLFQRFRFFQKTFENGDTVRTTLNFVSTHGDEINVSGIYRIRKENYEFSTTLQKTKRTKDLAVGDRIWLVVDRDNPENAGGWDGTHQRKISWAFESHDDTIEDMKEDPSESEIVKLIQNVYAQKVEYAILEVNKEKNFFMQVGYGGAPLEVCVGPDGPIYGVSAVPVEMAIKSFLSYNAGEEYWKTALPWEVHVNSIKDSKGK